MKAELTSEQDKTGKQHWVHCWISIWKGLFQIDLFRLYILFSQYRSCDDTQEIWSFVLFIKKSACKHEYALSNEQDKG